MVGIGFFAERDRQQNGRDNITGQATEQDGEQNKTGTRTGLATERDSQQKRGDYKEYPVKINKL